jgi:hypothetical protein
MEVFALLVERFCNSRCKSTKEAAGLNRKSLRDNLLLNPWKIFLNVDVNARDVLEVASNSPRHDACLVVKAWIAWNRAD